MEATRHRALGRAIGRLSSVAMKAANGIVTLAKGAESESVQLRACRAILADQRTVAVAADGVVVQGHPNMSKMSVLWASALARFHPWISGPGRNDRPDGEKSEERSQP